MEIEGEVKDIFDNPRKDVIVSLKEIALRNYREEEILSKMSQVFNSL